MTDPVSPQERYIARMRLVSQESFGTRFRPGLANILASSDASPDDLMRIGAAVRAMSIQNKNRLLKAANAGSGSTQQENDLLGAVGAGSDAIAPRPAQAAAAAEPDLPWYQDLWHGIRTFLDPTYDLRQTAIDSGDPGLAASLGPLGHIEHDVLPELTKFAGFAYRTAFANPVPPFAGLQQIGIPDPVVLSTNPDDIGKSSLEAYANDPNIQAEQRQLNESMDRQGYGDSFWDSVAFQWNQGESVFRNLDPLKEQYGKDDVDLAVNVFESGGLDMFGQSIEDRLSRGEITLDDAVAQWEKVTSDGFADVLDSVDRYHTSPGRDLARAVLPESEWKSGYFTALSGTADAVAQIVMDPTLMVGRAAKTAQVLRYGIEAADSSRIYSLLDVADSNGVKYAGRANKRLIGDINDFLAARTNWRAAIDEGTEESLSQADAIYAASSRMYKDFMPLWNEVDGQRLAVTVDERMAAELAGTKALFSGQALRATGRDAAEPLLYIKSEPIENIEQFAQYLVNTHALNRLFNGFAANTRRLMPGKVGVGARIAGWNAYRRTLKGSLAANADRAEAGATWAFAKDPARYIFDEADEMMEKAAELRGQGLYDEAHQMRNLGRRLRRQLDATSRRWAGALPDRSIINYHDANGAEQVRRYAQFFLPKYEAERFASMWRAAGPAARRTMAKGLMREIFEAAGFSRSVIGRDFMQKFIDDMGDEVAEGYSKRYSFGDADVINETYNGKRRGALYETQLEDGFTIPPFKEMQQLAAKAAVLGANATEFASKEFLGRLKNPAVALNALRYGLFSSAAVDDMWRFVKTGWLATPAAMGRQVLDEYLGLILAGGRGVSSSGKELLRSSGRNVYQNRLARTWATLLNHKIPRHLRAGIRSFQDGVRAVAYGHLESTNANIAAQEKYLHELDDQLVDSHVAEALGGKFIDTMDELTGGGLGVKYAEEAAARGVPVQRFQFKGYDIDELDGGDGIDSLANELGKRFVAPRMLPRIKREYHDQIVEHWNEAETRRLQAEIEDGLAEGKDVSALEESLQKGDYLIDRPTRQAAIDFQETTGISPFVFRNAPESPANGVLAYMLWHDAIKDPELSLKLDSDTRWLMDQFFPQARFAAPPPEGTLSAEEFLQSGRQLLHGTGRIFENFDPKPSYSNKGWRVNGGVYFTEDPTVASTFAWNASGIEHMPEDAGQLIQDFATRADSGVPQEVRDAYWAAVRERSEVQSGKEVYREVPVEEAGKPLPEDWVSEHGYLGVETLPDGRQIVRATSKEEREQVLAQRQADGELGDVSRIDGWLKMASQVGSKRVKLADQPEKRRSAARMIEHEFGITFDLDHANLKPFIEDTSRGSAERFENAFRQRVSTALGKRVEANLGIERRRVRDIKEGDKIWAFVQDRDGQPNYITMPWVTPGANYLPGESKALTVSKVEVRDERGKAGAYQSDRVIHIEYAEGGYTDVPSGVGKDGELLSSVNFNVITKDSANPLAQANTPAAKAVENPPTMAADGGTAPPVTPEDELLPQVRRLMQREGGISSAAIQREFKVGMARARRLRDAAAEQPNGPAPANAVGGRTAAWNEFVASQGDSAAPQTQRVPVTEEMADAALKAAEADVLKSYLAARLAKGDRLVYKQDWTITDKAGKTTQHSADVRVNAPGELDDKLAELEAMGAEPLTNLDDMGSWMIVRKGWDPRIIDAKVYGREVDLTDPEKIPDTLREVLEPEGIFAPWRKNDLPNWDHDRSAALIQWMRDHGVGKVRVRDGHESGFRSWIALPEMIEHGTNNPVEAYSKFLEQFTKGRPPTVDELKEFLLDPRFNQLRERAELWNIDGSGAPIDPANANAVQASVDHMVQRYLIDVAGHVRSQGADGNVGPIDPELASMLIRGEAPDRVWLKDFAKRKGWDKLPPHVIKAQFAVALPNKAKGVFEGMTKKLTRFYEQMVTKPQMAFHRKPVYTHYYTRARIETQKMADYFVEHHGWDPEIATKLAQDAAQQNALDEMIKQIDSPEVANQFSVMSRNWWAFSRAQMDFFRRWGKAAAADPTTIRKAQMAVYAGNQAGIIDRDSDGSLIFTYPGTGWLAEQVLRVGQWLGLTEPQAGIPKVDDLQTKLTFLTPSFNQSLFAPSYTPMVSVPFRFLAALIPGGDLFDKEVDQKLSGDLGAGKNWFQQFLPGPVNNMSRVWLGDDSNTGSQVGGAVMAALTNMAINGKLGEYADTDSDKQRFLHDLRANVYTLLTARGIMALFLPGSPGIPEVDGGSDTLDADAVYREAGIDSLDQEFMHMVARMGPATAYDFWSRIHPEAIPLINGRRTLPSAPGANTPYTMGAADFVAQNKDFYTGPYRDVAAYFLPENPGPFDPVAYRMLTSMGVRQYRDISENVFLDIATATGRTQYYSEKDANDAQIEAAQKAGDTETAKRLQDYWAQRKELIFATNPGLKNYLLGGAERRADRESRAGLLSQMVNDPNAPAWLTDQYPGIAAMAHVYEEFNARYEPLQSQRSNDALAEKDSLKVEYHDAMRKIVAQYPQLEDVYNGVYRSLVEE